MLDELRKLYMNRTVNARVLAILEYEKILGNICFSEQIFHRKQSLGAPVQFQSSLKILQEPNAVYTSIFPRPF